jgi:hypothetical protein
MSISLTLLRVGQVYRFPVFYRFPNNTFPANGNSFYRIIIPAHPAANLQFSPLHEGTPGALIQSLVYMFQTILNQIIPFRAPTHQMGYFEKNPVTLD